MLRENLQHAGGILGSLGLPGSLALGQDGVHFLGAHGLTVDAHDLQLTGRDIDVDEVILFHQGNGAAFGSLGRDMAVEGPVDAPEKRPSVIRAMVRPSSLSEEMASEV